MLDVIEWLNRCRKAGISSWSGDFRQGFDLTQRKLPGGYDRAIMLTILVTNKPAKDCDGREVTRRAADLSGADLADIDDRAVEAQLREAVRSGPRPPLTTADQLAAAEVTRPSTKERAATTRNHTVHADQSRASTRCCGT